MKVRITIILSVLGTLLFDEANAGQCLKPESNFALRSDTAYWAFSITSNRQCLQGLRGRTMLISSINVLQFPKFGQVELAGPAFRYIAPNDGAIDTFQLEINGSDRGVPGKSLIHVEVIVQPLPP